MIDSIPHKQCCKCKEFFPSTRVFFFSHIRKKDGLSERCKVCWKKDRKPHPVVPEGYKYCSDCKQSHPKTTDFFSVASDRRDGFSSCCKVCRNRSRTIAYARVKEQGRKDGAPETLTCRRCGLPKPATDRHFRKNPQSRYGLDALCKPCVFIMGKASKQANLEARNAYTAWYSETHKEEIKERSKRWYQDGGKETVKANTRNRRARLRQAEGTHTAKDIQAQYQRQKGKCYYCHEHVGRKYHVDHVIPVSRGGSNDPSNLVIACHSCNESKNDRLPHEWARGGRLL